MLTNADVKQIAAKGMSPATIEKQLHRFQTGFPFIRLDRPATIGDGILCLSDAEKSDAVRYYREHAAGVSILKFVPASGAASRMFKHLFEFLDNPDKTAALGDTGFNSVSFFLEHLQEFAFYDELKRLVEQKGKEVGQSVTTEMAVALIETLLNEDGLNYAGLPKALILFHHYADGPRTAMEEHLAEGASYARNANGTSCVHFTLSPEHTATFDELIRNKLPRYEQKTNTKFDIRWSVQKPSTDILAVDEHNEPFRNPDGSLLFRPAGHGALLSNLAELEADLIFIKNIDNIVPDHLRATTVEYKQALAGYLLEALTRIHAFLRHAESSTVTLNELREMVRFASETLMLRFPDHFEGRPQTEQLALLCRLLNRPLRVCGMVKNEGEPGGGPFWVLDDQEQRSLQIVESAQVDIKNPDQAAIFRHATHFNPVDLVCSIRDHHEKYFNLPEFIDENTGLISLKSSGGKSLKAQELPGLWNGSMADWITVFVEVPVSTFSPVKTVNDLLRKEHQG